MKRRGFIKTLAMGLPALLLLPRLNQPAMDIAMIDTGKKIEMLGQYVPIFIDPTIGGSEIASYDEREGFVRYHPKAFYRDLKKGRLF